MVPLRLKGFRVSACKVRRICYAMSWQMLDGSSRKPRVSWAIPEHLRANSRNGHFSRSLMPAAVDPDALLHYTDNAIASTESAQATAHLTLLFPSSSSAAVLSSSSSVSHSNRQVRDGSFMATLENPTAHRKQPSPSASRFKSAPSHQRSSTNSLLRHKGQAEVNTATKENLPSVSEIPDALPSEAQGVTKMIGFTPSGDNSKGSGHLLAPVTGGKEVYEVDGISEDEDKTRKVESSAKHDAQAADDAYRAACSAFSEGHAELALSFLHVASAKCPPDKNIALGKVHRLMAATMQLLENNSAVLTSLPVDKDA